MYLTDQESHYSEAHYERVLKSGDYSQMAYSGGAPVGCVCCSVEDDASTLTISALHAVWRQNREKEERPKKKVVKILLLAVSPRDRSRGIGSHLLRHVIKMARLDPEVERLTLNVHVDNDGAIRLYRRFGFQIADCKANLMNKSWTMDLPIGFSHENQSATTRTIPGALTPRPQAASEASTPRARGALGSPTSVPMVQRRVRTAKTKGDETTTERSMNPQSRHRWTMYSTTAWIDR